MVSMIDTNWLFKDPLRFIKFINADYFPYERSEEELKLDFIWKSVMYGTAYLLSALSWEIMLVSLVVWVLPNYLMRNTDTAHTTTSARRSSV